VADNLEMSKALLTDAFGHHTWATLQLMDTCAGLEEHQLRVGVPGVYGSILETLRHLVGADCSYLRVTAGGHDVIDEDSAELSDLQREMEQHEREWTQLLSRDLDGDTWLVRHRPDGSESHATLGIRLAQALHHGTDHRSQICTVLTQQGIEPPEIDVWDYGIAHARTRRTEATT
jgi:uncharacterized damage-inducible protein DinB